MKQVMSPEYGTVYLKCLILVARADGQILPEEIDFINTQAAFFQISEKVLWSEPVEDLGFLEDVPLSPEIALQILKDGVFLSHADGDYSGNERQLLTLMAQRLGLEVESFERLEARLIGLWKLLGKLG